MIRKLQRRNYLVPNLKVGLASIMLISALYVATNNFCQAADDNDLVIIHLPAKPIGQLTEIHMITRPSGMTVKKDRQTIMAQGDIKLHKTGTRYKLRLNYNGSVDMSFLKELGPFLCKLDLAGFAVSDKQCKVLKYLPQLEDLNALESDIGDEGAQNVAVMKNLKNLTLSRTLVTYKSLPAIRGLENLTVLYIANVKLKDDALANLSGLHNLVKLRVASTEIGDAGIAHLAGLTNLEQIHMSHNSRITDSGIAKLKNLKKLKDLDIGETGVTAACASTLKELPKLKVVTVSFRLLGKAGVDELKRALPNVRVEDSNSTKVPLEVFEPLHSPMPGKGNH